MDNGVFLPSLSHWEFGNLWSGSKGKLRYYITVSDGENGKQMLLELWDQDVCRELAEITESHVFPVTQEGLDEMQAFLDGAVKPTPASAAPPGPPAP